MTARRRVAEAGVPEGPLTTDELVAATGVPRETLYEWVAWRLLPRPQASSTTATWPPGTLERARFVAEKLAMYTFEEVSQIVRRRWPSTSRPD